MKRLLLLWLVFSAPLQVPAGEILLPISPQGQVWEKRTPAYVTVEHSAISDLVEGRDAISMKLAKFAAVQIGPDGKTLDRIKPVGIELPDLDWKPGYARPIKFFLPLPPAPPDAAVGYKEPGEPMVLGFRDSMNVACLSFSGAYESEPLMQRLEELKAWIRQNNKTVVGPPRLLLYNLRDFRLDSWRTAEWQVPVR